MPMNPFYDLNSPSSFPPPEDEEDSIESVIFNTRSQSSSSSCIPIFFSSFGNEENKAKEQKQEVDAIMFSPPGSNEESSFASSSSLALHENKQSESYSSRDDQQEAGEGQKLYIGSVKWMSSKMRLMKKMMSSEHQTIASNPIRNDLLFRIRRQSPHSDDDPSNNSLNTKIRVCSECNTTKTPLWRGGPKGPKSLCNACGIRQRKARRAMAAAAAANGGLSAMDTSTRRNTKIMKEKRSSGRNFTTQYKKRCKLKASVLSKKDIRFDEFTMISLRKISALHQVLPQEEKEAAILLMALSHGLLLA